jgi:hypothetical protein
MVEDFCKFTVYLKLQTSTQMCVFLFIWYHLSKSVRVNLWNVLFASQIGYFPFYFNGDDMSIGDRDPAQPVPVHPVDRVPQLRH